MLFHVLCFRGHRLLQFSLISSCPVQIRINALEAVRVSTFDVKSAKEAEKSMYILDSSRFVSMIIV